jgi:hypothetical protein
MYICRSHNAHLISMFRTLYGTLVVSHVICNISFGKDLQRLSMEGLLPASTRPASDVFNQIVLSSTCKFL